MGELPKTSQNPPSRAESVLQFWFAEKAGSNAGAIRSLWFVPSPEFDKLCRERFLSSYEHAVREHLEDWRNEPRSCLALVLLLDQFPRNMFRGTARAFATDAKARELSLHAVASGFDHELSPMMRMFLYLPLQHSENLEDQLESVRLTRALADEVSDESEIVEFAEQHLEIIRRFGRFPGRNQALGRQSTPEESIFLKDE
ncbi:MAG: DUF924 family protein [Candidatus Binataceae bacterium]